MQLECELVLKMEIQQPGLRARQGLGSGGLQSDNCSLVRRKVIRVMMGFHEWMSFETESVADMREDRA